MSVDPAFPVKTIEAEKASVAFDATPYVEWASVFVGAAVALAVAFVLLTFGAAVGLSAVSPWTSTRSSVIAVGLGAAFWMILVHIWAFGLGGYLSGRMRHRRAGTLPAEVTFRDGAHGLAVWGTAVTVGAIVAAIVTALAASSGAEQSSTARMSDPVTVATDYLLRTTRTTDTTSTVRGEVGRILIRSSGRTDFPAADRTYLAELVAARTDIPAADASKRVDEAITQLKDATNRARKAAVVFGFITAATLLLGAAAAWWGATAGGRDRDENTIWPGLAVHPRGSSLWTKA